MTDDPKPSLKPIRWRRRQDTKSYRRSGTKRKSGQNIRANNALRLEAVGIHRPRRNPSRLEVETLETLKKMLSNTWEQMVGKAINYRHLSKRQLEFFRRYAINGRRLIAKSARQAGYETSTECNLAAAGYRNLKHPYAEELLTAFEFEEKAKMGLMVEDVAAWFEKIANAAMDAGDFTNANRAMEQYGKYLGMFVERKEITHRNVHNKEELDARIAELQGILADSRDDIKANITIQ